jgi:hypothetical protein
MLGGVSGTVTRIFLNVGSRAPLREVQEARLVAPCGIEGDRHFKADSGRQILLIEEETLRDLGVEAGALRENLVTRGFPVQRRSPGTRLKLGEALVELAKPCAPCDRLEELRPGLRRQTEGRRGVFARVVGDGAVRVGDPIGEATS